jgi:poly-gamma-glutamate capsule biosynthesis protein CapA/YwtB (metallophosphatase superfamily)
MIAWISGKYKFNTPKQGMKTTLTIGLTGDVMVGRTLDSIISLKGYDYPWGNLLPLMKETDLNIINLETTLTNNKIKNNKTFNFRASPDKVKSLVNANVTIVNLANNHIMDYNKEGLLETIETLDKAGIQHIGAGKNFNEATNPVVKHKNNISLGIFGLTDNEPQWKANSGSGINYIDINNKKDKETTLASIKELKEKTDIVIVTIHWGPNMQEKPSAKFIEFGHAMVDHGANIVHGHSAHILQGIEIYNNNLILYDTGDFVDDYVVDPDLRNDLSAFFVIKVNQDGILNVDLIPV